MGNRRRFCEALGADNQPRRRSDCLAIHTRERSTECRRFRRSSEAKLLPIEDERAEYKEAHRAAKKVVTKSHPGRMYTRRGELNKQESSDQLIESAEGLDC